MKKDSSSSEAAGWVVAVLSLLLNGVFVGVAAVVAYRRWREKRNQQTVNYLSRRSACCEDNQVYEITQSMNLSTASQTVDEHCCGAPDKDSVVYIECTLPERDPPPTSGDDNLPCASAEPDGSAESIEVLGEFQAVDQLSVERATEPDYIFMETQK